MMKIEIHSTHVDTHEGVSKRTGNAYQIRKQQAWCHIPGEPHPRAITIPLAREQQPYPEGTYQLSAESFYVNKFGQLDLRPALSKAG